MNSPPKQGEKKRLEKVMDIESVKTAIWAVLAVAAIGALAIFLYTSFSKKKVLLHAGAWDTVSLSLLTVVGALQMYRADTVMDVVVRALLLGGLLFFVISRGIRYQESKRHLAESAVYRRRLITLANERVGDNLQRVSKARRGEITDGELMKGLAKELELIYDRSLR